ncbi:NACHT, LRR and PYD domains-containing protein 12-like [Sycon ciliatum]|uniref:NACHT, LRR and PYD domains-containing protein 12-like n=1 Tax=Sycon ciliatum TaxID=27933 RepID=UPI0031F6FFC5|eukprot:scpid38259/ scgid2050/ NACHT, LRR and PYD domains-containing protein 3; Cold autoinflammatory syndrome 1 protein homolog; Cryopyrin; Mast cell maturation-associated-inducible protein 1; PYRIN-containing APAF1-like protein 1
MEPWQDRWIERYRPRILAAAEESGAYMPEAIAEYLNECGFIGDAQQESYDVIMTSDSSARQKCEQLFELLARIDEVGAFDDFQDALRQNHETSILAVTESQKDLLRLAETESLGESTSELATITDEKRVPDCVLRASESLRHSYVKRRLRVGAQRGGGGGGGGKLDDTYVDVTIITDEDLAEMFHHNRSPSVVASRSSRLKTQVLPKSVPSSRSSTPPLSRHNTGLDHVFKHLTGSLKKVRLELLFTPTDDELEDADDWPRRVLAVASAGCGKTVLFTIKIPHDWASGDLWAAHFDLLCVVQLNDVAARSAHNTEELLQLATLGLTAAEQAELAQYVHAHPERVCLILDGLDECHVYECSLFVQQVIYDQCPCLAGMRVIITSRPCIATSVLTQRARVDRRLEIIGFTHSSVYDFVRKYLTGEAADGMLRELKVRPDIVSVMSVPFFARLTCDMYQQTASLPQCTTEIFETVTLSILRSSASAEQSAFATLEQVPGELRDALDSLCAFAYKMLRRRVTVFGQNELQAAGVSEVGITLGFLVQSDAINALGFAQFRFSHLTLQEFLAALHIRSRQLSASTLSSLFLEVGTFDGQYHTFWHFVAGLSEPEIAEALAESALFYHVPAHNTSSDNPLYSTQLSRMQRSSSLSRASPLSVNTIRRSMRRPARSGTLPPVQHDSPEPRRRRRSNSLSHSLRQSFSKAFKSFRRPRIHFHDNDITLPRKQHDETLVTKRSRTDPSLSLQLLIYSCFHENRKMQERQHSSANGAAGKQCDIGAAGEYHDRVLAPWKALEQSMLHHGISFTNQNLQLSETRVLGTVLLHHSQSIRRVTLSSCGIEDHGLCQLLPGLTHCAQLAELHLADNSLSAQDMHSLGSVLAATANSMESFDVSLNPIGDGGMRELLTLGLHACRTLQHLYLHKTGITGQDSSSSSSDGDGGGGSSAGGGGCCQALNTVLLRFTCLRSLWLDGNRLGDAGLAALATGLQRCSRLSVLHLGSTGLTAECFATLNCILPEQGELKELYLNGNDFTTVEGEDAVSDSVESLYANLTQVSSEYRNWRALVLPKGSPTWLHSQLATFQSKHPKHLPILQCA